MGARIDYRQRQLDEQGLGGDRGQVAVRPEAGAGRMIAHPQSIIHSLVQFRDGSMKAQLGLPDMKLPIQYAFGLSGAPRHYLAPFRFHQVPELLF